MLADWIELTKPRILQDRPLACGRLKPGGVLLYALVLGFVGELVLFYKVNALVGWLGLFGMFVYVVVYTMWLKRTSTWSTSIGGVSGAMPPVSFLFGMVWMGHTTIGIVSENTEKWAKTIFSSRLII
ncbi:UbiA family prenyltransferase [Brevibacillus antibioticus]|uniref:UbiA family prenyltransferase n=1 Tax=Brevibacillus antibioticus TaxID=2570228 RepID=UPI001FCC4B8E|nr:UbiA family prenyltransferase [Brevibacillus antibioticus]